MSNIHYQILMCTIFSILYLPHGWSFLAPKKLNGFVRYCRNLQQQIDQKILKQIYHFVFIKCVFSKFTVLYLANVLKLLANGVLVLIANVVKEGRWRLKLLVNPMRLRTLKSAKDQIPFLFLIFVKGKDQIPFLLQSYTIKVNLYQLNAAK